MNKKCMMLLILGVLYPAYQQGSFAADGSAKVLPKKPSVQSNRWGGPLRQPQTGPGTFGSGRSQTGAQVAKKTMPSTIIADLKAENQRLKAQLGLVDDQSINLSGSDQLVQGKGRSRSDSNSNDQSQAMQDKISTLQAENDRLTALLNDKEQKDQSLTDLNDQSIALEEPVVVPAVVPDVSELQKAVQAQFPSLEKDDIDKVIQLVQAIKDSEVKSARELMGATEYQKLKNDLYPEGFSKESGITPASLFQLSQPDGATAPSQSRPDIVSAISNVAQSNENDSNRLDTQGATDFSRPKLSFLSDIKVPTPKTSSRSSSVTDGQSSQESLVFKSYGDYLTALTEVQKAAEAKALLPIEEKANKEFDEQWPVILQEYRSDRENLGKPVQEDLIPFFESKTKKSIYDKISAEAKNKESVNQAVKNAENEFKSKATYPKKIFSSGKTIDNNLGDISTIKSKAENKMKDEILKQLFTPKEELVWKEDYSLNYEKTNQSGRATQSTINEAWKMYRDIESEKRLTLANKMAIKEAGKKAIEDFKAKQAQDAKKAAAKLAKTQLSQTTSSSNNDQSGSQSPVAVAENGSRSTSPLLG